MSFITNAQKAVYDFDAGRVNFYAEANGNRVLCAVSEEALQDYTGVQTINPEELIDLYRGNHEIIATIAEEKHRAGEVNADGYIVVTSSDVMR